MDKFLIGFGFGMLCMLLIALLIAPGGTFAGINSLFLAPVVIVLVGFFLFLFKTGKQHNQI
jgi:hypothetical protein